MMKVAMSSQRWMRSWRGLPAGRSVAFGGFDHLAQHSDGADVAHVEQRRQAEEDGGEDSGGERGGDRLDGQGERRA